MTTYRYVDKTTYRLVFPQVRPNDEMFGVSLRNVCGPWLGIRMTDLDSPWLSQKQVADYLGVTDRTIREYITRGDLPASRVRGSRLIRIHRDDVEALMEQTA
jgi:excisionase family DNA binding protein